MPSRLSRSSRPFAGLLFLLAACWGALACAAEPAIPEALLPWKAWVLHGEHELECPFVYNQPGQRHCTWPSRLTLQLGKDGGQFRQQWESFAESVIALPGDERHWPQQVTVNGRPAQLEERQGRPWLRLAPGKHEVSGRFLWNALPDALQVPPQSALVDLTVEGRRVPLPKLEAGGRLWLREQVDAAGAEASALKVQVFRRLIDEIPFRTVTRIELAVAGEPQEVLLGRALGEGMVPLSLDSPLPARVEPDGRIRVQLRAGQWALTLTARHLGPVHELTRSAADGPWAEAEIWSFDARPDLRLVELQGLAAIDPQQSEIPPEWRRLPAFRVLPGERLQLVEKRRGTLIPEPARLHLKRILWLDFDGGGYTLQDHISGEVAAPLRLELAAPFVLGRANVDGQEQFITFLDDPAVRGVELRPGPLSAVADSRLEPGASGSRGQLPATGWNHDFQNVSTTVQLPPGWRLLAAAGVDSAPTTWLNRWTLLDLFLVLIGSLAAARLFGWPVGALALVTLALTYHEPGAPQWSWLLLLGAVTLRRVLPPGRGRRVATGVLVTGIIVLALVALPFGVSQVRQALYPVLEKPWASLETAYPAMARAREVQMAPMGERLVEQEPMLDEATEYQPEEVAEGMVSMRKSKPSVAPVESSLAARKPLVVFDETAKVQTGPGVPAWNWHAHPLSWSGPVSRDQRLDLYLLPPVVNRTLALLRPVLILLLAAALLGIGLTRRGGGIRLAGARAVLLLPLVGLLAVLPAPAEAQAYPSPELLQELRSRLLQPPECAPQCATSSRLSLEIRAASLRLRQEIHAAAAVAVPLPGRAEQWLPAQVLVDGRPADALRRDGAGTLWLELPAGVHQLLLEGPLPERAVVQLALPLTPHRVEVSAEGWQVRGLRPDGSAEPLLSLERIRNGDDDGPELSQGSLPPFVTVERTLELGLTWRVNTRVLRQSPPGEGIVLAIPLLPGESVTTPGLNVAAGQVQVSLPPQTHQVSWESVLAQSDALVLEAPTVSGWSEVWHVAASPVWHLTHSGLPPVATGAPAMVWRPWPGEQVVLNVIRPQGAEGNTLTIDNATLRLRPGRSTTETVLQLTLRSSRGGQYTLALPEGADLLAVRVDGVARPTALVEGRLTLPLVPGSQAVELIWRTPDESGAVFRSPQLDLDATGVNGRIEIVPNPSRWILLAGGAVPGPAVLFWGVVLVILLLAFGLGRWQLTPLPAWQWFLLGIGLSQVHVVLALLVVGWLLALGGRDRLPLSLSPRLHNGIQVLLALLTLMALVALVVAISTGLLGHPDMQIAGNGSNSGLLRWYQDRLQGELATAWTLSVPLWVYRLLMLLWAIWLAWALLGWLRWGWRCYSAGALWRRMPVKTAMPPSRGDTEPGGHDR